MTREFVRYYVMWIWVSLKSDADSVPGELYEVSFRKLVSCSHLSSAVGEIGANI